MLFRATPELRLAPCAKVSEFLHFRVVVLYIVLDGETLRIIYLDVASYPIQDPGRLEGHKL